MFSKAIVRGLTTMVFSASNVVTADIFGTGDNQFSVDFVGISGLTNPSSGIPAGIGFTFTGVDYDYRMGIHEITNDQWNKFTAAYGAVTGSDGGYHDSPYYTGLNMPTNNVSWYEAAQFVNWLNASTGHQAAYKFTGAQGTADYTFAVWSETDDGYDASNAYRNRYAKYFLPTEDEWVKAAYWNGTALQSYATKAGESLEQGDGTSGTGWNYGSIFDPPGPWNVGSGSQELNGTYDMMGNISEWMETAETRGDYGVRSLRAVRGHFFGTFPFLMDDSQRQGQRGEFSGVGFRVASVPEPGSLAMLLGIASTALLCYWRTRA